ncbi:MAG TPA: SRPBCC family protein [Terriglobales bacterium]|nr:SRPBCC family protein [Terriglobales bacterium]
MTICRSIILILVFLGASVSDDELARSGQIREDAPVKASVQIVIHATVEKVWSVLTDITGWPKWQSDISTAAITGPLQEGTTFSWTTGGTHIKSRLALVQPCNQFAWTGTAFGAKAIHIWKLSRLAGDQTMVRTDESMQGFLLTLFYSSKKLEETDQRWLDRLKLAAESSAGHAEHGS